MNENEKRDVRREKIYEISFVVDNRLTEEKP